ncbi:MAG: CPBP family glutamic-type intramembrane protease [Bacteroidota bacterium]
MNIKKSLQKVFYFPLTKIVIGLIVLLGVVSLGQWLTRTLLDNLTLEKESRNLIVGIVTAVLSILSYTTLYRFYEKRTISELATKDIGSNLFKGIFLGALLQSLTIFVIYLYGGFSIVSINPVSFLVPPLTMAFTSAIFEEILVRGIIFRILEEKLGSYIALILSAAIFGALHLGNPNSSVTAALGLALQAGLFLAAAFMYTRNLWFPIAIHFAWNFTQAGIFGASVSGKVITKSLFTTKIEGADWYTGGAFGPEGSVQATVFCLIATICLLVLIRKQGTVIKPFWKQSNRSELSGEFAQ